MIIKVCGLKKHENHLDVSNLGVEMIGINFYKPSKRYIGVAKLELIDEQKRVGVFVKASMKEIIKAKEAHSLDYAQLHGDEAASFCEQIQEHIAIIKVFRIDEDFDWSTLNDFEFADMFLFDTKTIEFGGSGKKFDWEVLNRYKLDIPFMLSGGIGPGDAANINSIEHPQLVGVDINSKFESAPAVKDIVLIERFTKEIRKQRHDISSR